MLAKFTMQVLEKPYKISLSLSSAKNINLWAVIPSLICLINVILLMWYIYILWGTGLGTKKHVDQKQES